MRITLSDNDELLAATEQGRICALAAGGQRDLQQRANAHHVLFPENPFDPAVFSNVALATAFGAPWCTAEQLRIANRAALWVFAADWLIDYQATSRDEVDELVSRCLAVAGGAAPTDPLGCFLAEIRDDLAAVPAFESGRGRWYEELRRMLAAMAREWMWKSARSAAGGATTTAGLPTLEGYLDNADNFGSSFVNVSHWLYVADSKALAHLDELIIVGRSVQQVLRLVNDLATYDRDVGWGDLNALMLAVDRAEVNRRIGELVRHCRELLVPLERKCPQEVVYLMRQIGFSSGFYRVADFWGSL